MARIRAEQPLVPSVLDRLLDDDPDVNREAPRTRNQILRDLKQSVRRDLENLLNTRRRGRGWPPGLDELEKSLVNYGIPDFTGARMTTPEDREEFRQTLEAVLRAYESRFKSVKVLLVENVDESDRTLRFRIDGLLIGDPAPEPVVFDSSLEPTTGGFQVKGGS